MIILLCIFILGFCIGTYKWFTELNKPPTTEPVDQVVNVSDDNFELLEIELDTLHQLDKTIDRMLSDYTSEKERIQLLNKKATTINKIKRLEKELEKLL